MPARALPGMAVSRRFFVAIFPKKCLTRPARRATIASTGGSRQAVIGVE